MRPVTPDRYDEAGGPSASRSSSPEAIMPGLSQAFHAVIRQARALATSRNHDHFILEDIALALTDHDGMKKLVESRGGDVEQLRNDLKARAPVLPPYQANVMLVGGLPMLYPTGRGVLMYHLLNKMQPQPAASAGRVFQRARSRAESTERPDPGVYDPPRFAAARGGQRCRSRLGRPGDHDRGGRGPRRLRCARGGTLRRDRRASCRRWKPGRARGRPAGGAHGSGAGPGDVGKVGRQAGGGRPGCGTPAPVAGERGPAGRGRPAGAPAGLA